MSDFVKSILYPSELFSFFSFYYSTCIKKNENGAVYYHKSYGKKRQRSNFLKTLFLGRKYHRDEGTATKEDAIDSKGKCYYFLNKTSRSFAAVVQALDAKLRDAVCLFYLVLRGLDTIEDDMTIPQDIKIPLLKEFHLRLLDDGWTFNGNADTEKDRELLVSFDVVIQELKKLNPKYFSVIKDITKGMGEGMADFAAGKAQVLTIKDWNLYCYYVAGLVGIGLVRLFSISGLEDPSISKEERLAISMGLFLQKVNIIRDFHEDLVDGRAFWPKEICEKFGAKEFSFFTLKENKSKALECLNYLIVDALSLVPDVIEFMGLLKEKSIFKFCAIPQVMAIATIDLCYNNPLIFERNVKIRKGLALKLIMNCSNHMNLVRIFEDFCKSITRKMISQNIQNIELSKILCEIDSICMRHDNKKNS
jgi:farnesyl-diphosphate farnesyltransferase